MKFKLCHFEIFEICFKHHPNIYDLQLKQIWTDSGTRYRSGLVV